MTTFDPHELLSLDPPTLRGLLDLAPGDTEIVKAAYLGLDCSISEHRAAVERAYALHSEPLQAFSPPIGAGRSGVNDTLTPERPAEQTGGDGHPEDPEDGLGLPEPDPAAAAGMAEILASTAGTGRPFMAGTFALYSDPSGAVVMVTETDNAGVRRDVIPRKAVRFALGLMSGKRGGLLGRLIGG